MKKNYLIKTIGHIYLAVGILTVALMSSCLKDHSPGSVDFSKSPALLGWQYTGFSPVPYTAAIFGTPTDSVNLEITLSVASLTLKTPVTVTVVSDPTYITAYNVANGLTDSAKTAYGELSPSLYTLPNGGKVTINPGQQIVKFTVRFAGQNIDFTALNAIGLKLTNSSGATIASNLNEALILVTLKSIYAGTYQASGQRVHPTLGTFTFNYSVTMSTVDKLTIDGPALADLQEDLQLHINADNTVTVTSAAQTSTQNTPGLPNTYDPATKTFTLNYFYNTGAPRKITETLVYTGP